MLLAAPSLTSHLSKPSRRSHHHRLLLTQQLLWGSKNSFLLHAIYLHSGSAYINADLSGFFPPALATGWHLKPAVQYGFPAFRDFGP